MAAILNNGGTFEQIINTPSTECPMYNLMSNGQVV